MQHHNKVVCPNCIHTSCNSTYIVRAAAVLTESKKKKTDLTPRLRLESMLQPHEWLQSWVHDAAGIVDG